MTLCHMMKRSTIKVDWSVINLNWIQTIALWIWSCIEIADCCRFSKYELIGAKLGTHRVDCHRFKLMQIG